MIREVIYQRDFLLEENKRIVLKLIKVKKDQNFPKGIEFAIQYLYFNNNKWVQIARIDNQLHKGKAGTHIHIINKRVKRKNLTFQEARKEIIKIAERAIKWLELN